MEIKSSNIQELCGSAADVLNESHNQIIKILEAKKKLQKSSASDTTQPDLEKIDTKLLLAIKEFKQLCQQNKKSVPISVEVVEKIKAAIDDVLLTGNWEKSIFLKTIAVKLRGLSAAAKQLVNVSGAAGQDLAACDLRESSKRRIVPPGYTQVYILLYQVDGMNLQGWYHNIKTLTDYSVTRPAYKEESYAKEFIRSKASGMERNGYAIVNIRNEDFYTAEQPPLDAYGHQLFVLKENAVKLGNIVEFVHANKKHYAVCGDKLFLIE